ncbi:MAG: adenosine kinase, partial [Pseudomonadota bacterium]
MLELFGIGNAIVDIEVNIHDDFLSEWNIPKGQMILVDAERTAQLIAPLKDSQKNLCSGGSAANTTFAVQAFGASSAYTCKVADDEFGRYYLNEFSAAGLQLNGNALTTEARAPTGQCLILISDDAQRTMNTHLGVSVELSVNEVEVEALRQSRYFYVEGYLAASEPSTAAAV